ncbi:NAD-dependent epimerase/dehydratase family protein [Methylotenera sp.]|uniref:NAD-dependent epimerase/dehydratase family protein n=1 Tax=Methylotenera sp. TaxID=2051956 RepID=UPI002488ECE9|nr:NAD-dependent epimerase/dehydratase family protein [Methylotenera sp.]MDI1362197.1 NAD-dependent epimerase/dehydratase family protein [Methylotenera sp.]
MAKVLIVGCGDLGGTVAAQLSAANIQVTGVRRSDVAISGVHIIQADITEVSSIEVLKPIQPDIIIYCVAANGQTDEQYKANYVDGLRNLLATQSENTNLKHVFFVSSTRVYGQKTDAFLDESTPAIAADFGGERLLEAEALLNKLTCNTTVLRLSGIYGAGRLRMINLAKSPQNWPAQNSWSNRIHKDDAAAFMVFLVLQVLASKPIGACYIVTDSKPSTQYEVLSWIANQMQINSDVTMPAIEGGKRLSNQFMLSTGFQLQYPDFISGYRALLATTVATASGLV